MTPKVSIIIPNYNHAAFLEERLESIFAQIFQDFEVILLDDASTDGSAEILERYAVRPQVSHFVKNEKNSGGPFKQWQKGIDLARGEYLWIAESDDLCAPGFLESLLEREKSCKDAGLLYAQSIDIDEAGKHRQNRVKVTSRFSPNIWEQDFCIAGTEFVNKYLKDHNVIPNASAVVFKKELVKPEYLSGQLREMKMCGDWLFWIRLCLGTKVCFVAEPLNYFRIHPGASRLHEKKELREQRLLEEVVIRRWLHSHCKLDQNNQKEELYRNWFRFHSATTPLSKRYSSIKIDNYSYFRFFVKRIFATLHGS